MMVDASEGWGIGHSGEAYMQWYQPLSSNEGYRTLVNSHVTWLVELSWPLRAAYLLGWGAVLLLCWPGGASRQLAVPIGVWITFFVAAAFSSVAESPWLWIVPSVAMVAVLAYRTRIGIWPDWKLWLMPIGGSLLICLAVFIAGSRHPSNVQKRGDVLFYGTGEPKVWLLPDSKVLGSHIGRSFRREAMKRPAGEVLSIGVIQDPMKMPSLQGKALLITGTPATKDQLTKVMGEASSVTLVNPRFYPQEVGYDPARMKAQLVVGEFSESPAIVAWKEKLPAKVLPGVGDYLPDCKAVLGN